MVELMQKDKSIASRRKRPEKEKDSLSYRLSGGEGGFNFAQNANTHLKPVLHEFIQCLCAFQLLPQLPFLFLQFP
jgi:hypothetical protein